MIWAAIRCAMERNGIRSIAELARVTGIKGPTLTQTRRRNPNSFTWFELKQLHKVLRFTEGEWLMMMPEVTA